MTSNLRLGALGALLITAAAACGGKAGSTPLASDLQSDLDAAKSSAVQLAPSGARTQVVSAEELAGPGAGKERATQPARRLVTRKASQRDKPVPAPAPQNPKGPAVVNVDTLAPIDPRPVPSRPTATPSRRGGYKSVGDVIRDAPFPINP